MELLGRVGSRQSRPPAASRSCSRRPWTSWPSASATWPWNWTARGYNIGVKYGMLIAQLALALPGSDREEILARLVELLAVTLS